MKLFNIVRKCLTPDSAARLTMGSLIAAVTSHSSQSHPFVGRAEDLEGLERQLTDYRRPPVRAIHISGNFGSGRRTLGQKVFEQQYPRVGRIFIEISVDDTAGLEELHRKVLAALRPSITVSELRTRTHSFAIAPNNEKQRQVADLLNTLIDAREAAFLYDDGGVVSEGGAFTPEIDGVIDHLACRPHPPLIIISNRMILNRFKRTQNDLAYLALHSLTHEASERLISRLLKDLIEQATNKTPHLFEPKRLYVEILLTVRPGSFPIARIG
ncbi:MAG TPA: hypothetical protein VJY39_14920 [Acidisphaera sp.]|nr:hypothetical protein [Acidisphaera sp.]